jgi:hypothetical protein
MKKRYDKRNTPLLLNPGDLVMLKLHHGYRIPGVKNRKLSIQRVGHFKIKRRVSYELELPPNMKIHPVISVTNLGSLPAETLINDHSMIILRPLKMITTSMKNGNHSASKSFRLRRYGRGKKIIEYLVKWTDSAKPPAKKHGRKPKTNI